MSITHNSSADQDKDPGSNNRTNSQRRQVPNCQCFLEAMFWLLGIGQNLINGFRPEEGIVHGYSPA